MFVTLKFEDLMTFNLVAWNINSMFRIYVLITNHG